VHDELVVGAAIDDGAAVDDDDLIGEADADAAGRRALRLRRALAASGNFWNRIG
jgi:hypothetical protein